MEETKRKLNYAETRNRELEDKMKGSEKRRLQLECEIYGPKPDPNDIPGIVLIKETTRVLNSLKSWVSTSTDKHTLGKLERGSVLRIAG